MNSKDTMIFTRIPVENGKINIQAMREEIYALDIFRSYCEQLYKWNEEFFFWEKIKFSEERLIIRQLFSDDQQSILSNSIASNIADWLRTHPRLQVDFDEKKDKYSVNMRNGTLELLTGNFRKTEKKDYHTTFLNASYIKSKRHSEIFESFCERVFDKEKLEQKKLLLEQMIGYTVSHDYDAKKALFMIGPSNCGKSVILRFLQEVIGADFVSTLSMANLSDRFSKAELFGKTANLSGEIPMESISSKAYDTFKGVVGGDLIFAERKGKDPFSFKFTGTLVFAGNVLPTFSSVDGSEALISRMTLLVFNKEVEKTQRDIEMERKLLDDKDIIISHALDRLKSLLSSKYQFALGQDEINALENYRDATNSVASFMAYACCFKEGELTYISDAYDAYLNFAEYIAVSPDKLSEFKKKIQVDQRVKLAGKHRINGQSPKACFSGIKVVIKQFKKEYDKNQDTEMHDKEVNRENEE